ncbi:MAG TPA: shikimate kinase [Bryobacteraceae bacterium]|nr:shikimate kinase [Bryobacteraceae bacterium]
MILKLVRTPGIYLVGFMGSGKSTIGRALADRLGWSFVDLDREIEAEQGMTIAEMFDRFGEEHFRKVETEAIRKRARRVRGGHPVVMALGGGAFTRPENCEVLGDNGVTVWLDCPLEVARQRLAGCTVRPLARDPERLAELYEIRRAQYACADYRIDAAAENPEPVVDAICKLPIFK